MPDDRHRLRCEKWKRQKPAFDAMGEDGSAGLFNLFLEHIMEEELEDHTSGVKCGGIKISSLRFADDIDLMICNAEELHKLTNKVNN